MTGGLKNFFIYIFLTIIIIVFSLIRSVDEINNCINASFFKARLLEYLQNVIRGTAAADKVRVTIGPVIGISFNGVAISVRDTYQFSADEVGLAFSIVDRIQYGHWLRGLRIIRPKFDSSADVLHRAGNELVGYLPEIVIEDPDITLHLDGHVLKLNGGFVGHVTAGPKRAGDITASGTLDFRGLSIEYDNELASVRGLVQLRDGVAGMTGLAISADRVAVTVSGSFTPGRPGIFSGQISLDGMNIGTGPPGGNPILPAVLRLVGGAADLSATNTRLFGIPLERVTCRVEAGRGKLQINNIHASGGFLSGTGTLVIQPALPAVFDVSFDLKNCDIANLATTTSDSKPWIAGSINLKGRLWGTSISINGDLSFSSFNGRIKKYEALSKIFAALNIYKLILNRNPDMEGKGFPYNSIVAHSVINDSVMKINDLYLDSNSVQMSAVGTYSLRGGSIDAIIGLRLLESVDVVINALPVFGWILRGKDKGFFVMDLKVTGTLEDFSAWPVPIQSISRKISEIIINTFMLPYVLFTRPANLIPGLTKKK
jgi:hypothetical protein